MSNCETKVINMTAENEETIKKYSAFHSDDLNEAELREFCEALREELDIKSETIETVTTQLKDATENQMRCYGYWKAEERKVKFLTAFIKAGIKGSDFMTAAEFIEKIIDEL